LASALDLLAEIAVTALSRDMCAMSDTIGELIDLGTLRLQRAAQRLERQDHAGAMNDLRAALQHMRRAGADPREVEHLTAIIAAAERRAS
jgi:Tfp pilus assembly protein PilF